MLYFITTTTPVHIKHTSAHIHTSALIPCRSNTGFCKVLDTMPAISAYSAKFPPSLAAI